MTDPARPMLRAVPRLAEALAEREHLRATDPEAFAAMEARAAAEDRRVTEAAAQARAFESRGAALRSAGVDPETAETLSAALGGPPVVAGHAGSAAAARAVLEFVRDRQRRTLLLWGPTGHGKTWASTWALTTPTGLLVNAREDVHPNAAWDAKRSLAMKADLLLFDELGREEAGPWFAAESASIIEARQTRGLRTIITSNLPPRINDLLVAEHRVWQGLTIDRRYGDRLADRLYDVRHGLVVRIQGPRSIREMEQR